MPVDAEDFDRAFREYSRVLWRRAIRMLGDPAEAEDIVQEAYARYYHRAADVNPELHLAWLMTTADNLCLNRIRSQGRWGRVADAVGFPRDTTRGEAEPEYSDIFASRRLLDLVSTESERVRQIIIAHYVDGESLAKIGTRLNLHPRRVQRIHERFVERAKKKLNIRSKG